MNTFTVTMYINARDAEHAQEIMSEVMGGVEDAHDGGYLLGGSASFDAMSLKEV